MNDSMFTFRSAFEITSNTDQIIYFKAPAKFLGDKRRAYQHRLTFYLKEDGTGDLDTDQGDVILKGKWFPENLVHKFDKAPDGGFSEFSVSIVWAQTWSSSAGYLKTISQTWLLNS